jgi:hypothetical protein
MNQLVSVLYRVHDAFVVTGPNLFFCKSCPGRSVKFGILCSWCAGGEFVSDLFFATVASVGQFFKKLEHSLFGGFI